MLLVQFYVCDVWSAVVYVDEAPDVCEFGEEGAGVLVEAFAVVV